MASEKQRTAPRQNLKKAQTASRRGGMDTAAREGLGASAFAFPKQRKEPLNDARHVRNAVSRFDQVEDVTDAERDAAWKRIKAAGKKYKVEIEAESWRDLAK